jgi:hypothetical protein
LLPFERHELVPERRGGDAVLDRLDELPDFAFNPRQLSASRRGAGPPCHPKAIHLPRVLVAELLEQVLPLASQRTQDAPFDLTARNGYLSPEQRLLCVLKKMGFSSREIAEARHTTVMDIDGPDPIWWTG